MQLQKITLCNFQSFGPSPTSIDLEGMTYILGPNGAGKTAILQALCRMFSPIKSQREVQASDFHVAATSADPAKELWIEVQFTFPEITDAHGGAAIPPNFLQMQLGDPGEPPYVTMRLTAEFDSLSWEVGEPRLEYILSRDEDGTITRSAPVSHHQRKYVEVRYLPARRDPSELVSFAATSLVGRMLRAAQWGEEKAQLEVLSESLAEVIGGNLGVQRISKSLASEWRSLHKGTLLSLPVLGFDKTNTGSLIEKLTLTFTPSASGRETSFELLSDGQKSLLYIAMVLSWQKLAHDVLERGGDLGEADERVAAEEAREPVVVFDPDKLNPPVHTIVALEEPENSLGPQYLGRIFGQIKSAVSRGDVQCVIATHSPALLRRVDPRNVRFLRLDSCRQTSVRRVVIPQGVVEEAKYVSEAVQAYPELYFSRLVILGEGASEQLVLPRILRAAGLAEDEIAVSVVPLGGRHVNHFWRLLDELGIPHVTLLDLDCCRFGGGWGRVKYAMEQKNARTRRYDQEAIDSLPAWDDLKQPVDLPRELRSLEEDGVFFSSPLDLDLLMLTHYASSYGVSKAPALPDEALVKTVLGKQHAAAGSLGDDTLFLFDGYRAKFLRGSKPASHLRGLAELADPEIVSNLPPVLSRLTSRVRSLLEMIPE